MTPPRSLPVAASRGGSCSGPAKPDPRKRLGLSRRAALVALGAVGAVCAHAEVTGLNDAINKAGRQRMLSQRMSKAWLALGQEIEAQRAERVLAESMATFDRSLFELKAYAPTPEVKATYVKLEAAWSDYKGVLVGSKPALAAAPRLLQLDAQVLALAHQGTQQLEQQSDKPLGHLVNLAGRQRMLSQRIAKFQLALAWKLPDGDAAQQIETARGEFAAALDKLAAAPETTAAIQEQIVLARQQWIFFNAAINRARTSDARDARNVFVASENILQVMDHITGLYARAAG
jgi:nitrate/nitrite-specific signal transduction histidine kinase